MSALLSLDALIAQRSDVPLFAPLSLSLVAGTCAQIIAANGAGKTTLLRTVAGLHGEYSGAYEISPFLYQGHRLGLDELLNPLENLRWFGALEGIEPSQSRLREVLDRVGMLRGALTPVGRLSQGQKRRVGMARWLLSEAQVWLLDEPLTALDANGQALTEDVLSEHCAGGGVVLAATHQPLGCAAQTLGLAAA